MALASVAVALGMAMMLYKRVKAAETGNATMNKIADQIQRGAKSFLKVEYTYLAVFVAVFSAILLIVFSVITNRADNTEGVRMAANFIAGAALSALAGWIGMVVATDANVRVTNAADKGGMSSALRLAFSAGAVMGFIVVGLGLLGISCFYLLMTLGNPFPNDVTGQLGRKFAVQMLSGFGFGASSIALFARVAGGIYTKAADVGADLVGKVEAGIPEDDPRNPAVIADNVGDNVGDVAGMGADLFESFVGSIIAAATLANGDNVLIALPFWIAGVGVLCSSIGFFFVSTKDNASQKELLSALHKGTTSASILVLGGSAGVIGGLFGQEGDSYGWYVFACIVIGLICGILIGEATEFFTSYSFTPVQSITNAGITGPATVIIQGLGIGMLSTFPTVFLIVLTILGCNALAGQYGIALAAVGMLSTLGITLATDAYGPVADNAGGIAEMADLDAGVRATTDALDALGNTTAATGKGFAIGSAVLTSLSLLVAFRDAAGILPGALDIMDPVVMAGVLFGAMLPYLFAALTMLSVRKAAGSIILEVRRQFSEIPGIMEGTAEADSDRCIEISTVSSLQEMILPGLWAILAPMCVGFTIGPKCLTGMLGGAISSGMMLAIMMSNAGGAWDNSKKYIEIEGACGGKGTETHKACVVGDTVGDPFKDTSGPALNILIKLMSMISLVMAPLIYQNGDWDNWYFGIIPIVLLIVGSYICYVLYWKNIADITAPVGKAKDEEEKA